MGAGLGGTGLGGSTLTGAGFGGATVSLVADEAAPDFVREVGKAYAEATGAPPPIYVTRATNGVEVLA